MPAISPPKTFVETLPSGRVRAGFRTGGRGSRKVTRTFDYAHEATTWAEAEAVRYAAAATLGIDLDAPVATAHQVEPVRELAPARAATPTVSAYGATWLADRRGSLVRSTANGYATHLEAIGRDRIGGVEIGVLRRSEVEAWITRQRDGGDNPPTINARLKVLRMVLKYAATDRIIEFDPTAPIAFLPTDIKPERVVTREEEVRLLAGARTVEDRAAILLGLDAGLRWEEALALPADAILPADQDGRAYLVVRQVVERTREIRKFPKGKRARVVPLTPRLAAALEVVRVVAEVRGPDALLFVSHDGDGTVRPVDYHNWRRDHWRKATASAGLVRGSLRVTFHDLRHTYGTRLSAAGVPRREIAELMGHADESTTARYVHAGTDGRRHDLVTGALVA